MTQQADIDSTYTIDPCSGIIEHVEWIPSPNFDERPVDSDLELIVVHGISLPPDQFGGEAISQLFTNQLNPKEDPYFEKIKDLRVSAHVLIRRDGSIIQFVPFHKRAWHAGVSLFNGRQACNDFSIGIELEGTDRHCYTASQYHSLAKLIKSLWRVYPSLRNRHVVGHSEIAPGRKTDPGPCFVWSAMERLLNWEKTIV
ncbi:1,6-anhydro-N-acetylmuramyl-L-alanine amidase AmpD [Thiomicrorhabdus heinhorstiae]|uniref:1,6-anhydro-N-acetylmuramyl-L-alanine amidase AmpD n=1 Tax=Thiomicrorhabdus heinhorstiae TaxID=2748010 RepID=A0ABS0BZG3_9GAMM|nr:1,6-anhydro-N-acetylmuramyl-L-alanine amidase AmpD [Thiomicrorhabdus heinhorstiae]MBF6058463.1 1,6-anhydro-N-acetylmuramyl-L-alanine amidase AmpD [Thiomicrorhabdus heinhorstiae]